MRKVLVLHGPNLNMLGKREPEIYANQCSLKQLDANLQHQANSYGLKLASIQSNSESFLIDVIHKADFAYLIFNPAAFSHSSIALRDAILSVKIPFIEVHISNIYRREPFRQHSYFSDIALGVIIGCGVRGYFLALNYIYEHIQEEQSSGHQ